jgi:thymidylate kinase
LYTQGFQTFLTSEPKKTALGMQVHEIAKSLQGVIKRVKREHSEKELCFLEEQTNQTIANNYWLAMIDNLQNNIIPALNKGKIVICDRSWISTVAYQLKSTLGFDDDCSLHYNTQFQILHYLHKILKELPVHYFYLQCSMETIQKRLLKRTKPQTQSKADAEYIKAGVITIGGLPPRQQNDDPSLEVIKKAMEVYDELFDGDKIHGKPAYTIHNADALATILVETGFGSLNFAKEYYWNL